MEATRSGKWEWEWEWVGRELLLFIVSLIVVFGPGTSLLWEGCSIQFNSVLGLYSVDTSSN